MFYLFLLMFLLSSKLPPISRCTNVLPSSPVFPLPEVPLTSRDSDSHSDYRLRVPIFKNLTRWDRTGWDTSFPTARSTWKRDHWHTQAASVVVQTEDQSSQITWRLWALLKPISAQIHPIILHSKATVSLSEFAFYPFTNTCFLFHIKDVWYSQIGQVYSRSTPG